MFENTIKPPTVSYIYGIHMYTERLFVEAFT